MARKADIDDANKTENKIKIKGIKQKRYCTDVLCCIIYAAFIASIIYIILNYIYLLYFKLIYYFKNYLIQKKYN